MLKNAQVRYLLQAGKPVPAGLIYDRLRRYRHDGEYSYQTGWHYDVCPTCKQNIGNGRPIMKQLPSHWVMIAETARLLVELRAIYLDLFRSIKSLQEEAKRGRKIIRRP